MNLWNKVCNVMSCRGSTDCPPQLSNFNPTWYFCVGLLQRSHLWHKASNTSRVPARNWTVLNSPPSSNFGGHLPLTLPSLLTVSQTWQWSFWTPALLPFIHKGQCWCTYWFHLLKFLYLIHWMRTHIFLGHPVFVTKLMHRQQILIFNLPVRYSTVSCSLYEPNVFQ